LTFLRIVFFQSLSCQSKGVYLFVKMQCFSLNLVQIYFILEKSKTFRHILKFQFTISVKQYFFNNDVIKKDSQIGTIKRNSFFIYLFETLFESHSVILRGLRKVQCKKKLKRFLHSWIFDNKVNSTASISRAKSTFENSCSNLNLA
jgi:hypothetical protein